METKLIEVRDAGTFLPVVAIRTMPANGAERYLLARLGYGIHEEDQAQYVLLARLSSDTEMRYDPYRWPGDTRTMPVAHQYIIDHWPELETGAVVDVQYILGETATAKTPERLAVQHG